MKVFQMLDGSKSYITRLINGYLNGNGSASAHTDLVGGPIRLGQDRYVQPLFVEVTSDAVRTATIEYRIIEGTLSEIEAAIAAVTNKTANFKSPIVPIGNNLYNVTVVFAA